MSGSPGPAKSCLKMRCLASVASSLLLVAAASSLRAQTKDSSTHSSERPRTVHYELKLEELKYVFGPLPPVMRVHAGDIIDTTTVDADGKALEAAGLKVVGPNPLTGPFYVEGAEPGDTLVVRFLAIDPNTKEGFGGAGPGFGALNSSHYTPMLGESIPTKSWVYPIDTAENVATFHANDSNFSVKIPLHPFLGCVGVAPADGEARSSIVPAEYGGNMDAPEASVGNTLYVPVNVPGALLFFGDGHAAMGDGEIAGSAIEVPMKARLQFDIVKRKHTGWPRFENEKEIMAAGIYRPVDDAVRIAFTELVGWIHADYGLSELDAYELLSEVGKIHLTEMVDPNYVGVASVEKKFLPPKK